MSADFIRERRGSKQLATAKRQQCQLSYLTQSSIQDDVTKDYLDHWANQVWRGPDYFTTWVKMIFRPDNYMTFSKFLRFPLPSAKLVNDDIVPQLKRVFTAEDSYRKYQVAGKPIAPPEELKFDKFVQEVFNAYLFGHNDVIFTDLDAPNRPYREVIDIRDVVAIEMDGPEISRVAYSARRHEDNGTEVGPTAGIDIYAEKSELLGYVYADRYEYRFYDREYNLVLTEKHDLGECPADFVSQKPYYLKKDQAVRRSVFSYVSTLMEEFNFLSTLLKMTEPNGAIPVTTVLDTKVETKDGNSSKGVSDKEPMSSFEVGGAQSRVFNQTTSGEGKLQTGTVIKVPVITNSEGVINMDIVERFMKFHYIPVECLEYINTRIAAIRDEIIGSVVGQFKDNVDVAKNTSQVFTGLNQKQDNLKCLADDLSEILTKTDFKFLALQHGRDKVQVDVFFGTDFFLESQDLLYDLFEKSPNPIESRRILERLSKNRNRNNPSMAKREMILYNLMPFASSKDFSVALEQQIVDDQTKLLQLRFPYWIDQFEAEYGDIVAFWNNEDQLTDKQRVALIYNLIIEEVAKVKLPPKEEVSSSPAGFKTAASN